MTTEHLRGVIMKAITDVIRDDIQFTIDWLSVTIHGCDTVAEFKHFFSKFLPFDVDVNLQNIWFDRNPRRFYKRSETLNGGNVITIEYSLNEDHDLTSSTPSFIFSERGEGLNSGILLELSGTGLRYMGRKNFDSFLVAVTNKWDCHFTRIDLACDFFNPSNDIVPRILEAATNSVNFKEDGLVISKVTPSSIDIRLNAYKDKKLSTANVSLGKRGNSFCRLYDKYLQEKNKGNDPDSECKHQYWYRLELVINRGNLNKKTGAFPERANDVVNSLIQGASIQSCFIKYLPQYFGISTVKYSYANCRHLEDDVIWYDFLVMLRQNSNFVELRVRAYTYRVYNPDAGARRIKKQFGKMLLSYASTGFSLQDFCNEAVSAVLDPNSFNYHNLQDIQHYVFGDLDELRRHPEFIVDSYFINSSNAWYDPRVKLVDCDDLSIFDEVDSIA